jgi:hypothetical protein
MSPLLAVARRRYMAARARAHHRQKLRRAGCQSARVTLPCCRHSHSKALSLGSSSPCRVFPLRAVCYVCRQCRGGRAPMMWCAVRDLISNPLTTVGSVGRARRFSAAWAPRPRLGNLLQFHVCSNVPQAARADNITCFLRQVVDGRPRVEECHSRDPGLDPANPHSIIECHRRQKTTTHPWPVAHLAPAILAGFCLSRAEGDRRRPRHLATPLAAARGGLGLGFKDCCCLAPWRVRA